MSATYWEADQNPVPMCIAFVRNVVNVVVALYRMSGVYASFDSPAEADLVRYPTSAKVFVLFFPFNIFSICNQ